MSMRPSMAFFLLSFILPLKMSSAMTLSMSALKKNVNVVINISRKQIISSPSLSYYYIK
jgi:hypothetical protein